MKEDVEEKLSFMDEYILPFVKSDLIPFVINLAIAIGLLWIGLIVIKKAVFVFTKRMENSKTDATLVPFLSSILNISLKILLFITVIGVLGVPTTSFAAILAATGIAVGMALSGTLQNFAGGVVLLILKPFKIEDVIEAQGYIGKVNRISLFVTVLKTFDNKTILIPNGSLANGNIVNYTEEEKRRVDWKFGIAYGDDIKKAKEIIHKCISMDDRILNDPAVPLVEVSGLGDSSVDFAVRVWVKTEDYWLVFFKMNENIYNEFNANGINIPFPQMDVHLHNK